MTMALSGLGALAARPPGLASASPTDDAQPQ
jgi:hypothetical protein